MILTIRFSDSHLPQAIFTLSEATFHFALGGLLHIFRIRESLRGTKGSEVITMDDDDDDALIPFCVLEAAWRDYTLYEAHVD